MLAGLSFSVLGYPVPHPIIAGDCNGEQYKIPSHDSLTTCISMAMSYRVTVCGWLNFIYIIVDFVP